MKKRSFLLGSLLAFTLGVSAQSYSLRTNVLGLATTNLNLEASLYSTSDKLTKKPNGTNI